MCHVTSMLKRLLVHSMGSGNKVTLAKLVSEPSGCYLARLCGTCNVLHSSQRVFNWRTVVSLLGEPLQDVEPVFVEALIYVGYRYSPHNMHAENSNQVKELGKGI